MQCEWTNWSGSVRAHPQRIERPASESELCHLVRAAAERGQSMRVVGSGHSFSPLCATSDSLISLDRLSGIDSIDQDSCQATVWAGTKLHALGGPLEAAQLALANQGDVDVQSVAGAIATGTHGTGFHLGNLSTMVAGLTLVTADGSIVACNREHLPELFEAARLALGALGIITRVRLQLVRAYRLHERTWRGPVAACLDELDERIAANRHYEFFWYPATDLAHHKALNPTDASPTASASDGERIDASWKIFPSVRDVRFNEIEYAVPAKHGPACFRALRDLMRRKHARVSWPIEYRTVAADDIPLSPAFGRATVALSLHQAAELPYTEFFADAEAIFREFDGRPHWGKMHTLCEPDLARLYPRWNHFQQVRKTIDPAGRFLNPQVRRLFEPDADC